MLPSNYDLCCKRLDGLLRRLQQIPELLREYNDIISDQLKTGIVKLVTDVEPLDHDKVHYLPHHHVIRRD